MRILPLGQPAPLKGGGEITRGLPLWQWRRKDGRTSFLRDLMELRKPLFLCEGCLVQMPRRWTEKYDYALIRGLSAELAMCDWCRRNRPVDMFETTHGKYHADMLIMQRSVQETEERERQLFLKDRKFLIGY